MQIKSNSKPEEETKKGAYTKQIRPKDDEFALQMQMQAFVYFQASLNFKTGATRKEFRQLNSNHKKSIASIRH